MITLNKKALLARYSSYMIFGFAVVIFAVAKGIIGETEKPKTVFEKK